MSTAIRTDPCIQEARVTEDEIIVYLADGRVVNVPLAWSWRLSEATPSQRANFRLIGTGQGIHWPELDEDISLEGMLHGEPAHSPRSGHAADAQAVRRAVHLQVHMNSRITHGDEADPLSRHSSSRFSGLSRVGASTSRIRVVHGASRA